MMDSSPVIAMPENSEAESALLGAMLMNNRIIEAEYADALVADDFYYPFHGRVYQCIQEVVRQGRPANPVSIKPYIKDDPDLNDFGGYAYFARLTGDINASLLDPKSTIAQIRELASLRRMIVGLKECVELCLDAGANLPKIVSCVEELLHGDDEDSLVQSTGAQAIEELLRSYGKTPEGVSCGAIPALDQVLGPIEPKQLAIVAGRPGMGKTAVAVSYGMGAARKGHGVLFISLEMSSRQLAGRMLADECFERGHNIPYALIREGKLGRSFMDIATKTHHDVKDLPFTIVDIGQLTCNRLRSIVRRHSRRMEAKGQKLDLVIVDYLQLLAPDTKGRSNYEAVSEISRALKAISKDYNVAVMALAQLSRNVEQRPDHRPMLSDLRDSGQIEQDADAVLFLLREEYYLNKTKPEECDPKYMGWESTMEKHKGRIEFIVAKLRNGVEGSAFGQFHGAYQAVR